MSECCLVIEIIEALEHVPSRFYESDGRLILDLDSGSSLSLDKKAEELNDINQISIDVAAPFTVPASDKNFAILREYLNANIWNQNFKPWVVRVTQGGEPLRMRYLYPRAFNEGADSFELILSTDEHWVQKASELRLCDLNLPAIPVSCATWLDKMQNNAQYVDGDDGYWIPLVNYGGQNVLNYVPIEFLRPWYSLLYLLQVGFCQIGFKLSAPALETAFGRRILSYVWSEDYGKDRYVLDKRRASARMTLTDIPPYGQVPFTMVVTEEVGISSQNEIPLNDVLQDESQLLQPKPSGQFGTFTAYTGTGIVEVAIKGYLDNVDYLPASIITNLVLHIRLVKRDQDGNDIPLENHVIPWDPVVAPRLQFNHTFEPAEVLPGEYLFIDVVCDPVGQAFGEGQAFGINMSADFETQRVFFSEGEEIDPSSNISCKDSFLDLVKAAAHLLNAKFDTNLARQEVGMYCPYDVEWYGESVEGYYIEDGEVDDWSDKVQCKSERTTTPENNRERYLNIGFKRSQDKYIDDTLNEDEIDEEFNHIQDLGEQYRDATKSIRNPLFEPTLNGDVLIANQEVQEVLNIPVCWDNEDGEEISYKLGYRLLYAHGWDMQYFEEVAREWFFCLDGASYTSLPLAYQIPNRPTAITGTATTPDIPMWRLTYGASVNSLFNMFYRRIIAETLENYGIEFLIYIDVNMWGFIDFRKRYAINYKDTVLVAWIKEIRDWLPCSDVSTPVAFRGVRESTDCLPDPILALPPGAGFCSGNNPAIVAVRNGSCVDFSIGGVSVSPIVFQEWEYKKASETVFTSFGTNPTANLCTGERTTIKLTVAYDIGPDGSTCEPKTVITVINPCADNRPVGLCESYQNEDGDWCLKAEVGGVIFDPYVEQNFEYSVNGGTTWSSYTSGSELCGLAGTVNFRVTLNWSNDCADTLLEWSCNVEPAILDCDVTDADVTCAEVGGEVCCFEITPSATQFACQVATDVVYWRGTNDGSTWTEWTEWDGSNVCGHSKLQVKRVITFCDDCCPTYCSPISECQCCDLTADAGADESICPGTITTLTATPTGGTAPYTYEWQDSSGTTIGTTQSVNVMPASTETYTVIITDALGCTAQDSVTITVYPEMALSVSGDPGLAICNGGSTDVEVTVTGGTAPFTYDWREVGGGSLGTTNPITLSPVVTTDYEVEVTDANGCSKIELFTITVYPAVTADAGPDVTTCQGTVVLTGTPGGGTAPYTEEWEDPSGIITPGNPLTVSPPVTGTYIYRVTDANGCTAEDTLLLTASAGPTADAGADQTICPGDTATLSGSATGGTAPYSYEWFEGAVSIGTTQNVNVTPASTTTYTLEVTDASGCISTDTVEIIVDSCAPACGISCSIATNPSPAEICEGDSVEFTVTPAGMTGPYTYEWDADGGGFMTGSQTMVFTFVNAGTYTVQARVTDANGCMTTCSVSVDVEEPLCDPGAQAATVCQDSGTYTLWSLLTWPFPCTPPSPATGNWSLVSGNASWFTLSADGDPTNDIIDTTGIAGGSTASLDLTLTNGACADLIIRLDITIRSQFFSGHLAVTPVIDVCALGFDGKEFDLKTVYDTWLATQGQPPADAGGEWCEVKYDSGCVGPYTTKEVDAESTGCTTYPTTSDILPGGDNPTVNFECGAPNDGCYRIRYKAPAGELCPNDTVVTFKSETCTPTCTASVTITGTCLLTANVTGGCPGATYQWQRFVGGSWFNIAGATNSTYLSTANETVRVQVSCTDGCSYTSAPRTVSCAPACTATATVNQNCCLLTLITTNCSSQTQQWQEFVGGSWVNISGATGTTFNATGNGTYRAAVNCSGCPTIFTASRTVNINATISESSCVLTATVTGCTSVSNYQWQEFTGGTWQNRGSNQSTHDISGTNSTWRCVITMVGGCTYTSNTISKNCVVACSISISLVELPNGDLRATASGCGTLDTPQWTYATSYTIPGSCSGAGGWSAATGTTVTIGNVSTHTPANGAQCYRIIWRCLDGATCIDVETIYAGPSCTNTVNATRTAQTCDYEMFDEHPITGGANWRGRVFANVSDATAERRFRVEKDCGGTVTTVLDTTRLVPLALRHTYFSNAWNEGDVIDYVRLYENDGAGTVTGPIDVVVNVSFTAGQSNATIRTNLENAIEGWLTSNYSASNGSDYELEIEVQGSGTQRNVWIHFTCRHVGAQNWFGINKTDSNMQITQVGGALFNIPATQQEWERSPFNIPDVQYTLPCGTVLRVRVLFTNPPGIIVDSSSNFDTLVPLDPAPFYYIQDRLGSCTEHTLTANTSGCTGTETFEWRNPAGTVIGTTRSIVVTASGTYEVTVKCPGCPDITDTVTVP